MVSLTSGGTLPNHSCSAFNGVILVSTLGLRLAARHGLPAADDVAEHEPSEAVSPHRAQLGRGAAFDRGHGDEGNATASYAVGGPVGPTFHLYFHFTRRHCGGRLLAHGH